MNKRRYNINNIYYILYHMIILSNKIIFPWNLSSFKGVTLWRVGCRWGCGVRLGWSLQSLQVQGKKDQLFLEVVWATKYHCQLVTECQVKEKEWRQIPKVTWQMSLFSSFTSPSPPMGSDGRLFWSYKHHLSYFLSTQLKPAVEWIIYCGLIGGFYPLWSEITILHSMAVKHVIFFTKKGSNSLQVIR